MGRNEGRELKCLFRGIAQTRKTFSYETVTPPWSWVEMRFAE